MKPCLKPVDMQMNCACSAQFVLSIQMHKVTLFKDALITINKRHSSNLLISLVRSFNQQTKEVDVRFSNQ